MQSLNSTIWIFRPSFSATFLTCSMIWACGPAVTPILRGLSWARLRPVDSAAAASTRDLRAKRLFMGFPCEKERTETGDRGAVSTPRGSSTVGQAAHQPVADALQRLHENDQHQHHHGHHFGQKALVAVADAQVAQTAATNGTGH